MEFADHLIFALTFHILDAHTFNAPMEIALLHGPLANALQELHFATIQLACQLEPELDIGQNAM